MKVDSPPATAAVVPISKPRSGYWFRRRSVPLPTWRLWLCGLLTTGTLLGLGVSHVHSWLSVNAPIPSAPFLAIEGWVPDHMISRARGIADETDATRVYCTGIPLERGSYLMRWKNYAELTANTLATQGLDPQRICPVPVAQPKMERTRAMAIGLKNALTREDIPPADRKINLITEGTHARRSRATFQDVLGPTWQVGVYCLPSTEYKPEEWFQRSSGIKSVITELSALVFQAVAGSDGTPAPVANPHAEAIPDSQTTDYDAIPAVH